MATTLPQRSSSVISLKELDSVQNWKREQILGSGGFATITLWINTETNNRIAIKQFRNNQIGIVKNKIDYHSEQWIQEIKLMKKLDCENVVKALDLPDAFQSLKIDTPILVLEFCSGGDLRVLLNKACNCCGVEEKEVRQIVKQISIAIEYLHSFKIIHRDLKPENIVLQPQPSGKTLYKLTDLGYAKQLSDSSVANSIVGTLQYLAPELFMGVKYTSAVDNWSFGLLVYEVITGRRPFLPNHSMGEILEYIKKKNSSHISIVIDDEKGNLYFSDEISQFNRINSALKSDIESWLRIVLEYEPTKRGGQNAFQHAIQLVNKYTIQVFSIDTYEMFSYIIDEKTTLDELKDKLFSNTNISPKYQHLILPNGETAKSQFGKQIIESWYSPEHWFERYNPIVIYIFDYSKDLDYIEFYKSLTLPSRVEKMLLEPGRIMDYDELKLTWRNSVWVAQQTVTKYRLLNRSVKSCWMNFANSLNALQNKNHSLALGLSELFTSVQVLKDYVKFNIKHCEAINTNSNVTKDHLTNKISLLREIVTTLKSVDTFRNENIQKLFNKTKKIVPKFSKRNFLIESSEDYSLIERYGDILNAYDSLRKQKKEERTKNVASNLMINLLVDCFKIVEALMKELYETLSVFTKSMRDIEVIKLENQSFHKTIQNWKDSIDELQCKAWNSFSHPLASLFPSSNVSPLSGNSYHLNNNNIGDSIIQQISQIDDDIFELEKSEHSCKSAQNEFNQLEYYNLFF